MVAVFDSTVERAGVFENFYDARLATCEELICAAVSRAADCFPLYSFLSFWSGGGSRHLSLLSSFHAAPLGWNCAIAGDFPRWQKAGRVPALVCPMVRAFPLQMAERFAIASGIPRSRDRQTSAVLGRARVGTSLLGPVHDAGGFARHDTAYLAGRRSCRSGHEFSENGGES